jgi:hypothetical protein
MQGRLALSRRRQDGRAADAMLPLTERLLAGLPGPRLAWVLAWAAVPVTAGLLPGAYLATVGVKPLPVRLLIGLVFAYEVMLLLWAVGRFTRERDTVQRSVDQLAADPQQAATPVFRGMASTQGPLALTLGFVVVTVWWTAVLGGWWVALLWVPIALLVDLPLLTAVWVYLALLLGLNRLGRRSLPLTSFPQDPSLGLGEVGRLAFTAFWIYGAGFAPVLVVNLAYPLRLLLSLGLFLLGVLVFFGCLQGLHRQLLTAPRNHLEWAGQRAVPTMR